MHEAFGITLGLFFLFGSIVALSILIETAYLFVSEWYLMGSPAMNKEVFEKVRKNMKGEEQ